MLREQERTHRELEKSIAVHETNRNNHLQELSRGEEEVTQRTHEKNALLKDQNDLINEEQNRKQFVLELTQAGDELQEKINSLDGELEKKHQALRTLHRELDARQNELELT